MKVLLVQPRPGDGIGFPNLARIEPLGLEITGASLKGRHEVEILDLFKMEEFAKKVERFQPDAVGISCTFTVDVFRTLKLCQVLKEHFPHVFLFIGGHHATLNPSDFASPHIDAIVLGEGETTVPELIDCLERKGDLSEIQGLALFNPGSEEQVFTPARPLLQDLDLSPEPDRTLTRQYRRRYFLGFKRPMATVETSRGCPYKCTFCSVWRFYRNTMRFKSPEVVAQEIKRVDEKDIMIVDDNFFSRPQRALKIADLLNGQVEKSFIIQARSDTIVQHPYLLDAWRDCGLDGIFIGFEKIDAKGLEEVEKKNTIYNNEKSLEMVREKGMRVYASFIVDPAFTHEDFQKLKDYIKKWNIRNPYLSVLTPLPGTRLYDMKKSEITTDNWELYDFLHPVLPTRLPLDEFYQEFSDLYRLAYTGSMNVNSAMVVLRDFFRMLFKDYWSIGHLYRLYRGGKMMVNPRQYLQMRPQKSVE